MANGELYVYNDGRNYLDGDFKEIVYNQVWNPAILDYTYVRIGTVTFQLSEQSLYRYDQTLTEYDPYDDFNYNKNEFTLVLDEPETQVGITYDTNIYDNTGLELEPDGSLVSALYGYYTSAIDTSLTSSLYPSDSGNDQLTGDKNTNLIFGGDGDDVISGGDTSKTYDQIDTYNFYIDDLDNDNIVNNRGYFVDSFSSNGADFLYGNDGNDYLVGGTGDTVISGGPGNDTIFEVVTDGDENHLFGGEGVDVFIINADPNSGDENSEDFLDWTWDNIATDLSDLAFSTLKAYDKKAYGGFAFDFLKETMPIYKDLLDYYVLGSEITIADADETSITIYDFDPTEDIIFIYSDVDNSIRASGDGVIVDGDYGIEFSDNEGDVLVTLLDDSITSDNNEAIAEQFNNSAVFVEEISGNYVIKQNGETYSASDLGDSSFFSDIGLTSYGSKFVMAGAYGPQSIYGTLNSENIYGTQDYSDYLYGSASDPGDDDNDNLYGYGGNDWIEGGGGDDDLYGGSGGDTASYSSSTEGVFATLQEGYAFDGLPESANQVQGYDTFNSIENLSGSFYSDTLVGDDNDNILAGLGGTDYIFGGDGNDTVNFIDAEGGITIDLVNQSTEDYSDSYTYDSSATQAVTDDGSGDQDFLSNIENVIGSDYDDKITGDNNNNQLEGGEGNDTLEGRGGNDTLYGGTAPIKIDLDGDGDYDGYDSDGDGVVNIDEITYDDTVDDYFDSVSYSTAGSAITVDLEAGTVSDGDGGTDTLVDIDHIMGSDYNDTFVGDSNDNSFDGGAGTNTIDYSDGDGAISITIDGDAGTITVEDGSGGTDTLSNITDFIGSSSSNDSVTISGNTSLDYFSFEDIENITDNTSSGGTGSDVIVTVLDDELDGNFSDNDLSLREALIQVEDGGTISFDDSLEDGTIRLNSDLGQLEIDQSVTIDGSDLDLTIDADGNSRVIKVDDGDYSIESTVEIKGLTLTGGFVEWYSGSDVSGKGGGIFNKEALTVNNSTISGNTAESAGAGIYNYFGAELTVENSTISGNSANSDAGIRLSSSTVTVSNSTISGNSAAFDGGGIGQNGGSLTVNNSTITGNTAGDDGGGIFRSSGQISISSSLIAGNTASDEGNEVQSAWGGNIASGGNNLFGENSQTEAEALTDVDLADSDITATSDGTNPTALDNILDTSLSDGTHALVTDSPAIDAGSNPDSLTTDQRGADRVVDGDEDNEATIDIGAYELQTDEISSGTASNEPLESSSIYNDVLNGNAGTDELIGNLGNDWLFGGEGDDLLTGGGGNDQFVLSPGNGSDIVTDFEPGQDVLLLDDLTFEQLTIEPADSATVIQFGPEILASLTGVESSLITADDFIF